MAFPKPEDVALAAALRSHNLREELEELASNFEGAGPEAPWTGQEIADHIRQRIENHPFIEISAPKLAMRHTVSGSDAAEDDDMPATFGHVEWHPKNEAEIRYATRLATYLWEKHWKDDSPNWKPLPDLMGLLTEIDNMIANLSIPRKTLP